MVGRKDVRRFYSGARELMARHCDQVEAGGREMFRRVSGREVAKERNRMAISGRRGVRGQLLEKPRRFMEIAVERLDHFLSHFEAAGAHGWPERHQQIPGVRPEGAPQVPDGFLDDVRQCAAPAGMYRRHYTPAQIRQQ